ncbi:MAG: type III pantothenate kinase [Verrucomicrobiota bacterium]
MRYLLVNLNNTRTKFLLADKAKGLQGQETALVTAELTPESLKAAISDWDYDHAVLASVVPDKSKLIRELMGTTPLVEVSHQIELGVTVDFPQPQSVGADRLANAAAVVDRCREQPVIVVDFGTAVTFDIVDQRPAYVGGVIAPGLDSMRDYLHRRTALLPKIEISRPESAIGKSTEAAMQVGAYHGYRGLIREIVSQIEKELGERAKIVATGGYAELIAADLEFIESVEPLLTMDGLLRIAKLNF